MKVLNSSGLRRRGRVDGLRSRRLVAGGVLAVLISGVLAVGFTAFASKVEVEHFGEVGTAGGQFETDTTSPRGVAVNDSTGDVYVADAGDARIEEFSASGAFIEAWGYGVVSKGANHEDARQAVTVEASGGTFKLAYEGQETDAIAWNASAVTVQSAIDGLSTIGGASASVTVTGGPVATGELQPYFVAFEGALAGKAVAAMTASNSSLTGGAATARVATVNAGGVATGFEICKTAGTGGSEECKAGAKGGSAGELDEPTGVAVDQATGDVYVTDQDSDRVEEYDAAGDFLRAWGKDVVESGQDANGTGFGVCQPYDSSPADVCKVGTTGTGSGEFETLKGKIAVEPATGNVLVADDANSRVQMFTADGKFIETFGWGVSGTAGAFEVCTTAPPATPATTPTCSKGEAGDGEGQFGSESVEALAADSSGDVYALDWANDRVEKFAPSGGTATEPTAFTITPDFGPSGSEATPFGVAVDPENQNVLIGRHAKGGTTEMTVEEYEPDGTHLETDGEGNEIGVGVAATVTAGGSIAYTPSSGDIYLGVTSTAALKTPQIVVLSNPPKPTVTISEPEDVTATSAKVSGTVDPNGYDTGYRFEYSTDGLHWTDAPATDLKAGLGTTPVAVEYSLGGLEASRVYHVRLTALNEGTPSVSATSEEKTFSTLASPPLISSVLASPVEASAAQLTAYINPENSATSYYIEYGISESYGSRIPSFERQLGSGAAPVRIDESVSGLQPDTTYYFDVRAGNGAGTTSAVAGRGSFTTLSAAGACPNEALRAENGSSELPDCRAFEMVTPLYKEGSGIGGSFNKNLYASASGEGAQLVQENHGIYAGTESGGHYERGAQYDYARTEEGWRTTPLAPPTGEYPALEIRALSPDSQEGALASTLWYGRIAAEGVHAANWYLRDGGGSFTEVGPALPPSKTAGAGSTVEGGSSHGAELNFEGGSDGLSHILFAIDVNSETQALLWPGDDTVVPPLGVTRQSLYEYVGTGNSSPALVGVNNEGDQITTEGDMLGGSYTTYNAVSAQGATVFFTAHESLFARVGSQPATATTVNVGGSEECETSDFCSVTGAVSYQGASEDGTDVFFTSGQPLVKGDADTTENLYECEGLPGDSGASLPDEPGAVDHCPDLKEISAPEATGTQAKVLGVTAISEDGSHVYYVAEGVLTSAANAQGQTAQPGQDNLYVYGPDPSDAGHEENVFIGALARDDDDEYTTTGGESAGLWAATARSAQTTPDGDRLVFTSSADLTPGDTSTVPQVFEYDAATGALTRLSSGQEGYDDDGNTATDAAKISIQRFRPGASEGGFAQDAKSLGAISNNGEYVVFTSEAALAEGAITGDLNVYEYHDGNVSVIYDGKPEPGNAEPPQLEGIDPSGKDVFFTTSAQLVPADTDTAFDLYDARIDGGFKAPAAPAPQCEGEACLGSLTAPLTPVIPGSSGTPTVGNLVTPPEKKTEEKPPKKTTGVEITGHSVKGATVMLTVKAPAKGKLTATGSGLKKTTKTVKGAATYKLKLKLTATEQKKLKTKKKLSLKVNVAFKPASGKSSSATTTVSIKTASPSAKGSSKATKGKKAKKAK